MGCNTIGTMIQSCLGVVQHVARIDTTNHTGDRSISSVVGADEQQPVILKI